MLWKYSTPHKFSFSGGLQDFAYCDHFGVREVPGLRVRCRWSPTRPQRVEGVIWARAKTADLIQVRDACAISGRLFGGHEIWLDDVLVTQTRSESSADPDAPYPVARFVAGDIYVGATWRSERYIKPKVYIILDHDPVWARHLSYYNHRDELQAPPRSLLVEHAGFVLKASRLEMSGHDARAATPSRARRVQFALLATPSSSCRFETQLDLIDAAEAAVSDLLLVAGLAAKHPIMHLGGLASGTLRSHDSVMLCDQVDFARMRWRASSGTSGRRSFNDLLIEEGEVAPFLASGLKVLSERHGSQLRLALQAYLGSFRQTFLTQKFIALCTAVEAIREWYARELGIVETCKGRVASNTRAALRTALFGQASSLPLLALIEAEGKLAELFRPRIATVLRKLVDDYHIPVADILPIDKQRRVDFDFLNVRNKIVHQGYVPSDELLWNITTRTQYLVERILCALFEYRELQHLRGQWPVQIASARDGLVGKV